MIILKNRWWQIIFYDLFGALFLGISLHSFVAAADFAPGGVTGLSVIVNYLFDIPIGLCIILINIPIILFTFYKIKINYLLMSLKSIIICSIFLDFLVIYFPIYSGNGVLSVVLASLFAGMGYSLLFNEGSCSGGTDFIVVFLKKINNKISYGILVFVIDMIVILLYSLIFRNFLAFIYGLLYTFLTSLFLDCTTKILNYGNCVAD